MLNISDHLPVSFCLMVPYDVNQAKAHSKSSNNVIRDYRWDKFFRCENSDSDHANHLTDIDIYYHEIVFALKFKEMCR